MILVRHIGNALLFAFVLSFAVPAKGADASDLSPDQLLRKAVDATTWTGNMHLRLDFRTRPYGWATADIPAGVTFHELSGSGEIYASGDRLRILKQNADLNGYKGAYVDTLVLPPRRIMWVKNGSVQYSESQPIIEHTASLDRGSPLMGWFLDGVLTDQIYHPFTFSTALRIGKVQPNAPEETLAGIPCRVVDVVGDSWELHVWVAPSRGYNFARYKFDSEANPKIKRAEFHTDIDQIQYEQLANGTWIIQGGRLLNLAPDSHGGQHGDETVVNRTSIDVSPDFEKLKAFELPPIPDGTPVFIRKADGDGNEIKDDSGVENVWKDGKVESGPAFDPKVIEQMRKALDDDSKTAATQKSQ